MSEYQRSFLKWAGGKFKLLDRIKAHIPSETTRTIEPFAGSAVFSLNLGRGKAIVNDLNADLIDLYKHLIGPEHNELMTMLREDFKPSTNTKEDYLAFRSAFNTCNIPQPRKSSLFVYLNKHSFNGLVRYNASGGFNVPFGSYKSVSLPEKELTNFASRCAGFEFRNDDFETVMKEAGPGDFVYCDPPYSPSIEYGSAFDSYTKDGFSMTDHDMLVEGAKQAKKLGATVVISNHRTPGTEKLYAGADHIEVFDVGRSISCKGDQRVKVQECLAVYGGQS